MTEQGNPGGTGRCFHRRAGKAAKCRAHAEHGIATNTAAAGGHHNQTIGFVTESENRRTKAMPPCAVPSSTMVAPPSGTPLVGGGNGSWVKPLYWTRDWE